MKWSYTLPSPERWPVFFTMRSSIVVLFTFILSMGLSAQAATVTDVGGTVSDGQAITISGDSFGSGPQVEVFDDFESGTTGADIKTGAGSAKYGTWDARYGSSYYGDTSAVSGSRNFSSDFSTGYANQLQANLSKVREIYFSYWAYVPAGMNFPGEGTKDGDNWKIVWVQGSSTTDDDYYSPVRLKTSWLIGRNDQDPSTRAYCTINMVKGQWKRIMVWIKGSTSSTSGDGAIRLWELTSAGVTGRIYKVNINTLKATGAFEKIRFNGYGRTTPNCITSFDDVYVASGPNAQARIEIGNASTYAASTNLSILTPTSWSSDQITATVNVGSFKAGDSAYLFVVNANGLASAGYPITIGSSEGGSTPNETLSPPQDPRIEN